MDFLAFLQPVVGVAALIGVSWAISDNRRRFPWRVVGAGLAGLSCAGELEESGVTFVTDTCTYVTSILDDRARLAMCDSAKWAYYAPGNLGIEVVFGSAEECVESAVAGRVMREENPWN